MLRTAAGCDDRLSRLRLRRTNVDRRCEDATQRRVPKTGRLSPHLDDAIRTLLGGCAGLVIELTEPAGFGLIRFREGHLPVFRGMPA